jgi:hypothetical protein
MGTSAFWKTRILGALVAMACGLGARTAALGDLEKGQVVVGGGGPTLRVFDDAGVLLESLSDGSLATHFAGLFDPYRNALYATTIFSGQNSLIQLDGQHPHAAVPRADLDALGMLNVASMASDRLGNLYLGDGQVLSGSTTFIRKLSPSFALVDTFNVTTFTPGVKSLAVTGDGALAYYALLASSLSRYDLVNRVQLSVLPMPEFAHLVRLLPPYDAGAEMLVGLTNNSSSLARVRRIDAAGNTLQVYDFPGERLLGGIALAPGGQSFWAASTNTSTFGPGNLYRVGLTSGLVEVGPISTGAGFNVNSLAVIDRRAKVRPAAPPPLLPIPIPAPLLTGWGSPAWTWTKRL